jgi:DNA-binding transcriptional MocR family regulator
MGVNVLPCPIDALGLVPSALRALLETCRQSCRQSGDSIAEGREKTRCNEQEIGAAVDADTTAAATASTLFHGSYMPKALLTVPVGQNPTGSRLAPHRYQEIYAVKN